MEMGFVLCVVLFDLEDRKTHLHKAIGMRCDDGDVPWFWVWVVLGDILLHCQLKHLLLRVGCGSSVFSDVLGVDDMFFDIEHR